MNYYIRFQGSPPESCAKLQDIINETNSGFWANGDRLKVLFKSHEISYAGQSNINQYFVTKCGSHINNNSLQPYTKFKNNIPRASRDPHSLQ